MARECGRSPAQVALAWLRQRPVPVIPIIGAGGWSNCGTTWPASTCDSTPHSSTAWMRSAGSSWDSRTTSTEGHGRHDCLRRHARSDRHITVRLVSDLLHPTGSAVRERGKSGHGLISGPDRVFLYLALGRVSEWLAATLEIDKVGNLGNVLFCRGKRDNLLSCADLRPILSPFAKPWKAPSSVLSGRH